MEVSQRGQKISAAGEVAGLDEASPIGLLSTFLANAIDLERVAGGGEMVFASDLLLEFANFG